MGMAILNINGVDSTTGQTKPVSGGDTITVPVTVTGGGGDLTILAGNTGSGSGGDLTLISGSGTSGGSSVTVTTGPGSGSGGQLLLATGTITGGTPGSAGPITIQTGTGTFTGDIEISTGDAGTESGGISIICGSGTSKSGGITFGIDGGDTWYIDAMEGHFIPAAGSTYDIGASGTNIRALYVDTQEAETARLGIGTDAGSSGLILVEKAGTKIGGLTGPPVTLGAVYYDPNNGKTFRTQFGATIFIDGDGTDNAISGRDATVAISEILATALATDMTYDLAGNSIDNTTIVPGTAEIQVRLSSAPTILTTVTDAGDGTFAVSSVLPAGGTIVYATGVMTGVTATLESGSEVVAYSVKEDTSGEKLTPRGGDGQGTGDGGDLDLQGGPGGATGAGGDVLITSGDGGATSGSSGDVDISVGTTTSGTPGIVMINSLPIPTVLASITGVDLTTVANHSLGAVPTGRSIKVTSLIITPTSATAASGDAVVSLGTNSTPFDNIISDTTLTGLDATTEAFSINVSGIFHIAAAGETPTFRVDTADTGTTLAATVELIGYIL